MGYFVGLTALFIIFYLDLIFGSSYVPFHLQEELFPSEGLDQLPQLFCNDDTNNVLSGQTTDEIPIQYYLINITLTIKQYNSLTVSTCCNHPAAYCDADISWDTFFLYLFSTKRDKPLLREIADDTDRDHAHFTCNNTQKSILDLNAYSAGVYIIGVGGFDDDIGSFQIQLNCGTDSVTSSHYIGYLYFSVFGVFLLGFCIFYLHEHRRYYNNHHLTTQNVPSGQKQLLLRLSGTNKIFDATPLLVGIVTVLKQFHPTYTCELIAFL